MAEQSAHIVRCPFCGCYFDREVDDGFTICPHCEEEVEVGG